MNFEYLVEVADSIALNCKWNVILMFSVMDSVIQTAAATSQSAHVMNDDNLAVCEPAAKRCKSSSKSGAVPDLISLQKQTLDAVTELVAVEKERLQVEKQVAAMKKVKLLSMGHVQLADGSWLCKVARNARAQQFGSDDRDEE